MIRTPPTRLLSLRSRSQTPAPEAPPPPRPSVLSLFCGDPALAHPPSVPAALDAEGVDCVWFDVLLGGAAHDLGLPSVQSAVLRRIAALEFGALVEL